MPYGKITVWSLQKFWPKKKNNNYFVYAPCLGRLQFGPWKSPDQIQILYAHIKQTNIL